MADSVKRLAAGVQDTGNPVLDSLVNIFAGTGEANARVLQAVHQVLLELAAKEPGGLRVRDAGRPVSWAKKGKPAAAGSAADEPHEDFSAR